MVGAGHVRTTRVAREGAVALGLDFDGMLAVVMALTSADFHKSMTTHADDAGRRGLSEADSDRRCAHRVVQGAVTMKCPICGVGKLVHDTRDVPYTYKGESTILPQVTGDFCSACDESILDASESRRAMELMSAFSKQVNASFVDPDFIASVRKKLDLDQREAGEIFGGGVNAFSRYENGKTKPPLALVKLLKVLDRHPELLGEVRAA
jgi:HTH-type transcriptional regulator/antitoxin MqsA